MTKPSPPNTFTLSLKTQAFRRLKVCLCWQVEETDTHTHRVLHKSPCFLKPKSIQMGTEKCLYHLQFLPAVDSLQHKYTNTGHTTSTKRVNQRTGITAFTSMKISTCSVKGKASKSRQHLRAKNTAEVHYFCD